MNNVNKRCKHVLQSATFLLLATPLVGCGSDKEGVQTCDLESLPDVEFTRVELVEEFSSSLCPEVEVDMLNMELEDAGSSPCSTMISGCDLLVECEFDLAEGGGSLRYQDGEFSGFLEVKEPIECSYSVTAVER